MSKPLDQFGGWLKFFHVTNWIGVFFLVVVGILLVLALFADGTRLEKGIMSISLADLSISTVLIVKILRFVEIKDPASPSQIFRFMIILVLVSLAFGAVEALVLYISKGFEGLNEFKDTGKGIIRTLAWFAIWSNYFKKSKRVAAYYGDVAHDPKKLFA